MQPSSKAILALAAILLVSGAQARIVLETESEAGQGHLIGEEQAITTHIPFSITKDGGVYAKLLVTPWNPINDGTPNGSVEEGTGWRAQFVFLDDAGEPLQRASAGM